MSILLTSEIDGAWFGSDPNGQYYQSVAAALASSIQGRFATGSVLVAGCGHGHLVNQLQARGYNAWGVDASAYAVNAAKAQYPTIANRFLQGDCRVAAQMATVRSTALGGPASRRFEIIIAEDLDSAQGTLAVLSQGWLNNHPEASALGVTVHTGATITAGNNEALQCRTALAGILSTTGRYVHVISLYDAGTPAEAYGPGLWHTGPEWRAIFGGTFNIEPIYHLGTLAEF
jgi:SAM-dependent methyltransferase